MTDTEIIVTNMTLDDLFIAMQTTEEDREQARRWIENERHINTMPTNIAGHDAPKQPTVI